MIALSPKVVEDSDFVFIMEDFTRRKFTICSIAKQELEKGDVEFLFSDLAPRLYDLDLLWSHEFSRGQSVLLVLEKDKAVSDAQDIIGRFEVKNKNDFEMVLPT